MLHCVQAFTFEKAISTSTTKVPVSMQIWKNINLQKIKTLAQVKGLGHSIRKLAPTQILLIVLSGNS